ncbi:MAG: ATP-binding protein [Patescibacteria group bacterium]
MEIIKKENLIEILAPLNFWGKEQETGIKRENYLKKLKELAKSKEDAIALIGVRRAGKTFLTKQFLKEKIKEETLYVNFEDPKLEPYLSLNLLEEIYEAYRSYVNEKKFAWLVLDEIQNIEKWEKWVRIMQEKKEKVKIIITGSSSKLLSGEFSSLLTGRTLFLKTWPLSFKEFLNFKKIDFEKKYDYLAKSAQIKRLLLEYLKYGGFPKVVLEKNENLKKEYLQEIFEGIIYRDIISRYKIKDVYLVKTIAELSLNYFSSLLSASKLRNVLVSLYKKKFSPNLVVEILHYLENAFLVFALPIFSFKIKNQLQYPKKIYCVDSGLINILCFGFSQNIGKFYENLVFLELKRNSFVFDFDIFYWKDGTGKEVDFVILEKRKVKKLIQVCYKMENEKTKNREINALLKASQELKCNDLSIITQDFEGEEKINGKKIKFIPLWKWLLE